MTKRGGQLNSSGMAPLESPDDTGGTCVLQTPVCDSNPQTLCSEAPGS